MSRLALVGGGGGAKWTGGVKPVADTGTPSGDGPGAKDARRRPRSTGARAPKEDGYSRAPDLSAPQSPETSRPGLYVDFLA